MKSGDISGEIWGYASSTEGQVCGVAKATQNLGAVVGEMAGGVNIF